MGSPTRHLFHVIGMFSPGVAALNWSCRYHVKYMFVGDGVKAEVEKVIRSLRPALQLRLRFISHHGREDATPAGQPSASPAV